MTAAVRAVPVAAPNPLTQAPTYPVHLLLEARPVLVVGGGAVACRKVPALLTAGAAVTVVAPRIADELADDDRIRTIARRYQRGEVASYSLAITCTDDPEVNQQVARDGEAAGVWINSADDPANCTFILPAVARDGDVTVTISTAGRSPAVASWLRRRLEQELDGRYAKVLDVVAEVRAELRAAQGTSEDPRWVTALDDELVELIEGGGATVARDRLRRHFGLHEVRPS